MDGDENGGTVRQLAREDGLLLIPAGKGAGQGGGRGVADAERAQPLLRLERASPRGRGRPCRGDPGARDSPRETEPRRGLLRAGPRARTPRPLRETRAGRPRAAAARRRPRRVPRIAPVPRSRGRSCRRRSRRSRGGRGARRGKGKEKYFLLGRARAASGAKPVSDEAFVEGVARRCAPRAVRRVSLDAGLREPPEPGCRPPRRALHLLRNLLFLLLFPYLCYALPLYSSAEGPRFPAVSSRSRGRS